MPTCQKCLTVFPNRYRHPITKEIHNLCSRKFCIECSPFGEHNTLDITVEQKQLVNRYCPRCKETKLVEEFHNRRNGKGNSVYCKPCTSDQTLARQRKLKQQAIEYKGGKCSCCGYNNYNGALEFHHVNSAEKDFTLSLKSISFENAKAELDKCVLVCSNCHREIHAGLIKLC